MVSMIPNQFQIKGVVIAREKAPQMEAFSEILVRLEAVEHITGPANFLEQDSQEVVISMADDLADTLKKGSHIVCRIRKVPGRFFIIPDSLHSEMPS